MDVPHKRRRVEVACAICRQRKSRCDGQRPACSSCRGHDLPCRYENATDCGIKRRVEFDSQKPLIRKVKELEHKLNSVCSAMPHLRSLAPRDKSTCDSTESEGAESETAAASGSDPRSISEERLDSIPGETAVDTLATHAFNEVPERNIGYFGPTSNHALFRRLSGAFARMASLHSADGSFKRNNNASSEKHQRNSTKKSHTSQGECVPLHIDPFTLSGRPELTTFVNQFRDKISVVFPFIRSSSLLEDFDQQPSRTMRAFMNLICAHASSTILNGYSETFYRRALMLLDERTLRGSSIELLQALLLLSSFQQNNQRAVASWTYHAIAVKAAYQLGLHSPFSYRDYPLQERLLRQKLWHAVINQDKCLSVALGRPCLIPSQHIRIMNFQIPPNLNSITSEISGSLYFDHLTSLYAIQGCIIESIYDHNVGTPDGFSLEELAIRRLRLRMQLEEWRRRSQSFCDMPALPCDSSPFETRRFQVLLSIQYYKTILLLNSSILEKFLDEESQKKLETRSPAFLEEQVIPVIRSDLDTAIKLQEIIRTAAACGDVFLNSNAMWWTCNYLSFTVVLHIFGILLACWIPEVVSSLQASLPQRGPADIRAALESALKTLQAVERTSLMSRKARQCIIGFLEVFDSLFFGQRTSERETTGATQNSEPVFLDSFDPCLGEVGEELSEDFYARFVTQSADDFLFQCSDSAFLDADFDFT